MGHISAFSNTPKPNIKREVQEASVPKSHTNNTVIDTESESPKVDSTISLEDVDVALRHTINIKPAPPEPKKESQKEILRDAVLTESANSLSQAALSKGGGGSSSVVDDVISTASVGTFAMMGGKIGALLSPALGVLAPLAPVIGTAIGFAIGVATRVVAKNVVNTLASLAKKAWTGLKSQFGQASKAPVSETLKKV